MFRGGPGPMRGGRGGCGRGREAHGMPLGPYSLSHHRFGGSDTDQPEFTNEHRRPHRHHHHHHRFHSDLDPREVLWGHAPWFHGIFVDVDEEEKQDKTEKDTRIEKSRFQETVKVDKDGKKYLMEIVLGVDAKQESLKISRKDNVVTIEVKKEKTAEDGSFRLYQDYMRKLILPENVDLNGLESSLSSEGVLSIQAPFLVRSEEIQDDEATVAPIQIPIPIPIPIVSY